MIYPTPTELNDGWDELDLGTECLSLTETERAKRSAVELPVSSFNT